MSVNYAVPKDKLKELGMDCDHLDSQSLFVYGYLNEKDEKRALITDVEIKVGNNIKIPNVGKVNVWSIDDDAYKKDYLNLTGIAYRSISYLLSIMINKRLRPSHCIKHGMWADICYRKRLSKSQIKHHEATNDYVEFLYRYNYYIEEKGYAELTDTPINVGSTVFIGSLGECKVKDILPPYNVLILEPTSNGIISKNMSVKDSNEIKFPIIIDGSAEEWVDSLDHPSLLKLKSIIDSRLGKEV